MQYCLRRPTIVYTTSRCNTAIHNMYVPHSLYVYIDISDISTILLDWIGT